jgi:hypothetical protein
MAVYPRHTVVVDAYKARGEIIGIGPFAAGGSFILEGLIKSFVIRDWNDTMLD